MEKTEAKQEKPEKKQGSMLANGPMLAVVRIRGDVNLGPSVRQTLAFLKLGKKHVCVIRPDTPAVRGMLNQVKDYATWGTLTEETHMLLVKKRKTATENVFFLAPPRKGFGRRGIKKSFVVGGALGERREQINELIQRMI